MSVKDPSPSESESLSEQVKFVNSFVFRYENELMLMYFVDILE